MKKENKVKWYYRLFTKLDNHPSDVDMTNRVFAYILDWIAGSLITAFPTVIMYMAITKSKSINQDLFHFPSPYGYIAGVLSILFGMFYYIVLPLRNGKGQTAGKRFMEIKIVKIDGSDVDFKTMLLRQFIAMLILEGSCIACGYFLYQLISLITGVQMTFMLSILSACICVISIILALYSKSRRMLHDYIAHTKVISVKDDA